MGCAKASSPDDARPSPATTRFMASPRSRPGDSHPGETASRGRNLEDRFSCEPRSIILGLKLSASSARRLLKAGRGSCVVLPASAYPSDQGKRTRQCNHGHENHGQAKPDNPLDSIGDFVRRVDHDFCLPEKTPPWEILSRRVLHDRPGPTFGQNRGCSQWPGHDLRMIFLLTAKSRRRNGLPSILHAGKGRGPLFHSGREC